MTSRTIDLPQPPLLSLSVRRDVDQILELDSSITPSDNEQFFSTYFSRSQTKLSFNDEIETIQEILEQQCYSFVALKIQIQKSRTNLKEASNFFRSKLIYLQGMLQDFQSKCSTQISQFSTRFSLIEVAARNKPMFQKILPDNDFGRITGIVTTDSSVICTHFNGYIVFVDRKTFTTSFIQTTGPVYFPTVYNKGKIQYLVVMDSSRHLLVFHKNSLHQLNFPINAFCFRFQYKIEEFNLVIGGEGYIHFFRLYFDESTHFPFKTLDSSNKLNGSIISLAIDNELETVYAINSNRMFYSISYKDYQTRFSRKFDYLLIQLFLSKDYIFLSLASNDILLCKRNQNELEILKKLTISQGLRRIFVIDRFLFIITKSQIILRSSTHFPDRYNQICESESENYNNEEYIGCLHYSRGHIFISHYNKLSIWAE